jgi:hypothetical protein
MDAEIDAQFAAIADDVLAWKLRGAACWQAVGAAAAAAALLLSSSGAQPASSVLDLLIRLSLTYATTLLVLLAQRRVLAARDVPPVRLPLPRWLLGGGGKGGNNASSSSTTAASWPALFASRCVLRTRGLPHVVAALVLYGAYALSGAVGVALLSGSGSGIGGNNDPHHPLFHLAYGALLGLFFAVGHLLGCRNVVSYPSLDLRRWPRLRRRARAAARSALVGASAALAVALPLHHRFFAAAGAAGFPSTLDAIRAWRAALFISLAWLAGAHSLDVVFGEPLQFAGGDASATAGDEAASRASAAENQEKRQRPHPQSSFSSSVSVAPTALLAALRHPDPIVQDWAMRDLCLGVAERGGPRRRAIFADATGATGWLPATAACLAEVRRACYVLTGGTYADVESGAAAKKKNDGSAKNAATTALARASAAAAGAAGGATPAADVAAWHLRAYTPRLSWAARALASLCAASLREDGYGVALETGTLGESLVALLALEAALEARRRAVAAVGGVGGGIGGSSSASAALGVGGGHQREVLMDAAAEALLDAVRGGVYRVAAAFGDAIAPVVAAAAAEAAAQEVLPPPLRSVGEASARMRRYLDGEV